MVSQLNLLYESLYWGFQFCFFLLFYWFSIEKESKFLPAKRICIGKFLSVKGISSCTGNIIVWNFFLYRILPSVQEISSRNKCLSTWKMTCCDTEFPPSSWDRKHPTVTRNFFLWQEISSYDKKFLPVTRNFFLWEEISSCD